MSLAILAGVLMMLMTPIMQNLIIPGWPGAIADTYVSTSARTFNSPATYGQSLIADLIAEGITGVMGYAFEPYLAGVSYPDVLFDKYTNGYVLADSFFSAYYGIKSVGVIVGDPKTAIRKTYP